MKKFHILRKKTENPICEFMTVGKNYEAETMLEALQEFDKEFPNSDPIYIIEVNVVNSLMSNSLIKPK